MIKKAFDANCIKFAFPTVQIAGDGEPSTDVLALMRTWLFNSCKNAPVGRLGKEKGLSVRPPNR